jgi:hypothetical protein
MGEFINEVDNIRDKLNCVMLIIHHTGNQETHRARGSSSALAAMDAEMHVFQQGTTRIAKWVKLKDQPLDSKGYEFTLVQKVIGTDPTAEEDEEKEITSCVVEWGGETTVKATNILTKTEQHGFETLRTAIAATMEYSINLKAWRAAFYEALGRERRSEEEAFQRVRKTSR